jgi:type II secretory pathway component GspD/PulD (secretin)
MSVRKQTSGAMCAVAHALACAVMLGWFATVQAQQSVLEVIDLKYRSAEQIVPMLKPLLAPGGTVSALQNRLIVRTTPQNLAELRKVRRFLNR